MLMGHNQRQSRIVLGCGRWRAWALLLTSGLLLRIIFRPSRERLDAVAAGRTGSGADPAPDATLLQGTYAVERSDQQNASVLNAAVISVALAYVVAATSFLSNPSNVQQLGVLTLATPFPVLSLNGYISLQVAAGALRRSYLLRLESQMVGTARSGSPIFVALYHSLLLDGRVRSLPFKLLTTLTMWSPLVTSGAYTWWVMVDQSRLTTASAVTVRVVGGIYAAMLLLNIIVLLLASFLATRTPQRLVVAATQRLRSHEDRWRTAPP